MDDRWLIFIYRVPQQPPGRRTYVWRQLKNLGATWLQQAAAILPDREDTRPPLDALAAWVRDIGGEVSLLQTTSPDSEWQAEIVSRFNAGRGEEYDELVENIERFEDEVARETRKEKFTFAELEDLESDLEKIERWHERIVARDFFAAERRQHAETALAAARTSLTTFVDRVYAPEDPGSA